MQSLEKHVHFDNTPAFLRLKNLSQHPLDLTAPGVVSSERIEKYKSEAAGIKLLYATERVTDEVLTQLHQLADEMQALEKMHKMQDGEVLNFINGFPSENRSVLHTALRDFFDEPNTHKTAVQAAQMARVEVDKIEKFFKKADFNDLVVIGIGGSELGPKAAYLALEAYQKPGKHVHFIGNVDPDDAAMILNHLDLNKTLVAVVSKSGTTLETVTNEKLARHYFDKARIDSSKHFIAITGEGSPMDAPQKYLASFYFWDWIGGRYSTTSAIGGVILTFACGFDVFWQFLKGANRMDKEALKKENNIPLLGALLEIWNRNFLGYSTLAIIPYSRALSRLSAHIEQLEMESNGKRIDHWGEKVDFETSPIIWGEPGTNAQHSFFQMIHQGTTIVPIEFIGFKESQLGEDMDVEGTTSQQKLLSNLFAQALALATGQKSDNPNKFFPGNRPSHILLGKQLTPELFGSLFSYFENKIAFEGFIWNINSFDQEGVQLGKLLAKEFIEQFKKGKPDGIQGAFLNHLRSL